jgi:predicted hydrocarbon binding protein
MELDIHMPTIGQRMLHSLRHVLERECGEQAAALLQEAGYAAGGELYGVFARWLKERADLDDPADLAADHLSDMLGEFFRDLGWGSASVQRIGSGGLAVDSTDWSEAEPSTNALLPNCHITAGMLAGFLGQLADQDVAVMQVECMSCNDARCRFLAGSPETLRAVYDAVNQGKDYHQVLVG